MGFIFVGEGVSPVNDDDVRCLDALCEGIRLAADIVDKPTNFMHTDAFLDVSYYCVCTCVCVCEGGGG